MSVKKAGLRAPQRFIVLLLSIVFCGISAILTLNFLIDPLWFFSGNRLTGKNLYFNEREAKLNQYYEHRNQYDCVLFGASSATTLDVRKIPGKNCFNFAFSAGTAEEFAAYARYVSAVAPQPKLVILSLEEFHEHAPPAARIPKEVETLARPGNFVAPYLSFELTRHSLTELFRADYRYRYYLTDGFNCVIDSNHHPYTPSSVIKVPGVGVGYDTQAVKFLQQVRDSFHGSRIIGYSPYFSSWNTAKILFEGELDRYVDVRYEMAGMFDEFYDFAVPSPDTEDREQTFDGFHYSPVANRVIAQALGSDAPEGVVRPRTMSQANYRELYRMRTTNFISRYKITAKPEQ